MSAESMPVLSGAVPSFKIFMTRWEQLHARHPQLKPWINVGLKWAEKYYTRMDDTDAYVVAMCELLPSSLFHLNMNLTTELLLQSSIPVSVSSGSPAIGEEVILGVPKP